MGWRGPDEYTDYPTLGWGLIEWWEGLLRVPAGPKAGEPLRLTDDQKRFFVRLFALTPDGRRVYRRAARRGSKGKGKSPEGAMFLLADFAGPVVFDGWNAAGDPIGVPRHNPLCWAAATAEEQTDNVYASLREMIVDADLPIDAGKTRIEFTDGSPGKIEAVTASAGAREGAPTTAVVLDEALDVATPIPTPSGWAKMGDLAAGDFVIGADGNPTQVIKATTPEIRETYSVSSGDRFTDMTASTGHLWWARPVGEQGARIVTTQEMAESGRRWRIPVSEPVQLPDVRLPVDPWSLGMWLGDGSVGQGVVTSSTEDAEWTADKFRQSGYYVSIKRPKGRAARLNVRRDPKTCPYGHDDFMVTVSASGGPHRHCRTCASIRKRGGDLGARATSFRDDLAAAGVLHNKHVPAEYLRASYPQRLALLQGLMDSDGHISKDGYATFVTTSNELAAAVYELVGSIGETPRRTVAPDNRKASYSPRMLVQWRSATDRPPVSMPRKQARLKPRTERQRWRTVTVEPAGVGLVRCIAVDNQDQLFCAGDAWNVTHNTHLWFPSRGGDKLAAVIRRNLAKTGGVSLEVTNAPALGENSVAEKTLDAANKGQRGLLYDSVSGGWDRDDDPKDPENRAKVMAALREAYAGVTLEDDGWVDVERIYEDAMDVDTTRADVVRFFFNIAEKAENRAFDTRHLAAAGTASEPDGPTPKILMFDGARTRDCAVLSSWTLDDVPHHQLVQAWTRPHDPHATYEHPRGEIRNAVREFIAANDCVLFVYDSSFHELSSLYDEWIDEHGEANPDKGEGLMVGYPTASGQRMDHAIKRVVEDLREGRLTHDGDPLISEHLENAVLEKNRSGWLTLAKEKDSLKIDGAVTFTMGYDMISAARIMATNRKGAPAIYVALS